MLENGREYVDVGKDCYEHQYLDQARRILAVRFGNNVAERLIVFGQTLLGKTPSPLTQLVPTSVLELRQVYRANVSVREVQRWLCCGG